MGERIFRPAGFGMVRLAALPAGADDGTRVPLDPAAPDYRRQLVDLVVALVADPVVAEAIACSSGSLAGTIAKIEAGGDPGEAKLERAALAATRYVLRMTGRPTPFGLLAGVQLADMSAPVESVQVRIGDQHRKHVRPDAGWLDACLTDLIRDEPAVRAETMLVANNLCLPRGDRLVLPYVRQTDGETEAAPAQELTVGYTDVVRIAFEAARRPIFCRNLVDQLMAAVPGAPAEGVERLVKQLIEREILLTDLTASQDEADPFALVLGRLAGIESPDVQGLHRIGELLDGYRRRPIGAGQPEWRRAVDAMRARRGGDKPPIHVDLEMDAEFRLPAVVAAEAARAADVLWRLAPMPVGTGGQPVELADYHRVFLEAYGTDRLVPVLEALDAHRGLGPPAGYRVPASERTVSAGPDEPYPRERDEFLARLAAGNRDELVLDDKLVDRLAALSGQSDDSPRLPPPESMDLCVQLFAPSPDAIAAGEFDLAVSPGAGARTAGGMIGRFTGMLGAERLMAESRRSGPTDPIDAQLFYQTTQARHYNVTRVPRVSDQRIAVGCFDSGSPGSVDVRDIHVGSTGERLYLAAPEYDREIFVWRPHMVNPVTVTPNVARFLSAVGMSGVQPWSSWQWGRVAVWPRLPRVRFGRTVLSPATWRVDPALADGRLSRERWMRCFDEWREREKVADRIRIGVFDHHLDLDPTVGVHRHLIRDLIVNHACPTVTEAPSDPATEFGWSAAHANEIVVPMLAEKPRATVKTHVFAKARTVPASTDQVAGDGGTKAISRHLPGGEWLYAKIYLLADLHDSFLANRLSELVARLPECADRWFFLRYRDPDSHLRLRIHGRPDDLAQRVLPVVSDWAGAASADGAIRKLVLDTYEPEHERYGGPDAIEAAERMFQADSDSVVEQLKLRSRGGLPVSREILAAMNQVEILAGLGSWDWAQWTVDKFPADLQHAVGPADRRLARELVDPERNWEAVRKWAGGPRLIESWRGRAEATAAYGKTLGIGAADEREQNRSAIGSVLHMHANRLIGMDAFAEKRSYGMLRMVAKDHLGRRRHGRAGHA